MKAKYEHALVLLGFLVLFLTYLAMPNTAESHDIGRRTKILVGLENTASYYASWDCWYPSPDPNGGYHGEGDSWPSCDGGNDDYTSLDWQVEAETYVILNAWSSDDWGADQHEHYNPGNQIYCTGIDVIAWDPNIWQEIGRFHYVHAWRASYEWDLGVRPAGDTDIYLGNVEDEQLEGCSWSGPHLHQSGNRGMEHVWTGWNIPVTADPDNADHWVHEIRW